jgi:hypothetical protein
MIEYVTYKNEKLPILVSYRVLKHFKDETGGKDFNDIKDDYTLVEPLLFLGLQSGFWYEDKPFIYKKEDMEYLLDECFKEFSGILPKFFPSDDEVIDKKKVTKK